MGITRSSRFKRFCFYLTVVATCLILVFPLYWVVVTSLLKREVLLAYPPKILPGLKDIHLLPYMNVLKQKALLNWFINSAVVTFFSTAFSLAISMFAAYSLSRYKSWGNRLMGYSLLIIRMLPGTLMIIPLYIIFQKMGLLNNKLSLIIGNVACIIPFAVWMMKGYFDGIPVSLEESAQIDGCTLLQSIWKVILPLTAPGLAATMIYSAMLSWDEFLFAKTFMTGQDSWTITVGITSLIGEHVVIWDEMMAMTIFSILPILILFVILEKYLVSGLTGGAVKQ
jgi:multiple sugar transport system permease protein